MANQQLSPGVLQQMLAESSTLLRGPERHSEATSPLALPTGTGTGTGTEYPSKFNPLRRRFSVSAEPIPETEVPRNTNQAAAVVEAELKQLSPAERARMEKMKLTDVLKRDALFQSFTADQLAAVVNTLSRREYESGSVVVEKDAEVSEMYVVDEGEVGVFNHCNEIIKVVRQGQAFGSLAMMYTVPSQSTVRALARTTVWVLDRLPFKRVIMATSIQKRVLYENFLEGVDLLKNLTRDDRAKIADVLEPREFSDNEPIVRQGDNNASTFYLVEQGIVRVFKRDPENPSSDSLLVKEYHPGGYFGELALLWSIPRQATCVAVGPVRCLTLSREHFFQVLSGVERILRANKYDSYTDLLRRQQVIASPSSSGVDTSLPPLTTLAS